jgi:hypothetical protein
VRNEEKIEIPLISIERNPVLLLGSLAISLILVFIGYSLLKDVNPWGFMVMIPAAFLSFQTIWFLMNPFALIFNNRFEIKQSLFRNKIRYYSDIKKFTQSKSGKFYITFFDDDVELLNVFGIKKAHSAMLHSELNKFVALNKTQL